MQSREKMSKGTLWMIGLACVLGAFAIMDATYQAVKPKSEG